MCQQCVESVQKYYPYLTEEEQGALLMSATCFPFGSPEMVEEQLSELKEKTDGTLSGAVAFADWELTQAMSRMKE